MGLQVLYTNEPSESFLSFRQKAEHPEGFALLLLPRSMIHQSRDRGQLVEVTRKTWGFQAKVEGNEVCCVGLEGECIAS